MHIWWNDALKTVHFGFGFAFFFILAERMRAVSAWDGWILQYTIFIDFCLWCFHCQCIDTHHLPNAVKVLNLIATTASKRHRWKAVNKMYVIHEFHAQNASNGEWWRWQNEATTIIISKLGEFSYVCRKNAIRWLANIYEKHETTRFSVVFIEPFATNFRSSKTIALELVPFRFDAFDFHSSQILFFSSIFFISFFFLVFFFNFFHSFSVVFISCMYHTTNRTYWFAIEANGGTVYNNFFSVERFVQSQLDSVALPSRS